VERLLEFITTGPTLVFVGAGVSAEVGLPSWDRLAAQLIDALPTTIDRTQANQLRARREYPRLMSWIQERCGPRFLYEEVAKAVQDSGRSGVLARFVATFDFRGVVTTNFDSVVPRHFVEARRPPTIYGNSRADLEQVDLDRIPRSVVHVHSDLNHGDTLVLTEEQYGRARSNVDMAYLRDWIKAQFISRRILFLGYSMTDPDIELLLEDGGQNFRKDPPPHALLPNLTHEDRVRLRRKYNVEVIDYSDRDGTHRELLSMIGALQALASLGDTRPRPEGLDLRKAQSLYLWSRFSLGGDDRAAQVDSLKSIVLFALESGPRTPSEIRKVVSELVGLAEDKLQEVLDRATEELRVAGQLRIETGRCELSEQSQRLVAAAHGQHDKLREAFVQDLRIVLAEVWPEVPAEQRTEAMAAALDALVEVFDVVGVQVAQAVLGDAPRRLQNSVSTFAALARASKRFSSRELGYKFVAFMIELIASPRPALRAYVDHLALTFFSLHALQMDPAGFMFRKEYLGNRALLVDCNVLLQLLPIAGRNHEQMKTVVTFAKDQGLALFTTTAFLDEVHRHAVRALDLVREYGAQSVEVLEAATSERWNPFLDGFIQGSAGQANLSEYLSRCLGGQPYSRGNMAQYLESTYAIRSFDFGALRERAKETETELEDVTTFIRESAEAAQLDRSEPRMRAEAEASLIAGARWEETRLQLFGKDGPSTVAILSRGTFLNRVAKEGPHPVGKNVVIAPDVLYGFMLRFGRPPQSGVAFRELLVSPLFDSSSHFIDKDKYGQFFAELIQGSERVLQDHLSTFKDRVDRELTAESLDALPPLRRPLAIAGLQTRLEVETEAAGRRAAEAETHNVELQSELARVQRKLKRQEKEELSAVLIKNRKARKEAERIANRQKKKRSRRR